METKLVFCSFKITSISRFFSLVFRFSWKKIYAQLLFRQIHLLCVRLFNSMWKLLVTIWKIMARNIHCSRNMNTCLNEILYECWTSISKMQHLAFRMDPVQKALGFLLFFPPIYHKFHSIRSHRWKMLLSQEILLLEEIIIKANWPNIYDYINCRIKVLLLWTKQHHPIRNREDAYVWE